MRAEVIQNANVLAANAEHKNFTTTDGIIPQGSIINGKIVNVDGLRRGQPFQYKLFITNDKKIIHLKKIKPMQTTEVTLGADAKQTPTVINEAVKAKTFTPTNLIGAGIGAGIGWYFSKKSQGMSNNKAAIYIIGGAVLGYFGGKLIEKRRAIKITKSK